MTTPIDDGRLLARVSAALVNDDRSPWDRLNDAVRVLAAAGYHPGQVDGDGRLVPPPHDDDCLWCSSTRQARRTAATDLAYVHPVLEEPQSSTLIVGDWQSWCSACGGGASPDQTVHLALLGRGGAHDAGGCGTRWTQIAAARDARLDTEATTARWAAQRQVPYVGRWPR